MGLQENLHHDRTLSTSFNARMFDDAAFEVFFKKHFTALCAFCQYKFEFEPDLAKDVVHNGFIKLWENRQTISPELSIKSYLYKIITNLSLDVIKHERVKQRYIKYMNENSPEQGPTADYSHVDFKQLAEDVDAAMNELPEQMRRVLYLCRHEELKYAEVAQQMGISIKTVETQMSRAMARLKQKLAKYLVSILILASLIN